MTMTTNVFRELHRLQRHAKELHDAIKRAPLLLKGHQAKIAKQESILHEAQEAIKKMKVANHEKEVTLKATQAQIAKYEKQRNEATSKKEYDTLQAEIAAAREHCRRGEDQILEGMLKVEEKTAELPDLEKAVQQAKDEFAAFDRGNKERSAGQAEQLTQVRAKIKELEVAVPEEVRTYYNRLVDAQGGADTLAAVQGRTCSSCYTDMTEQQSNDLLSSRLVVCKACGRILYLPE